MTPKQKPTAQNPLILRCNRLIEAFAKSDDERDFFLDREEGFILYADLDKSQEELLALEHALQKDPDRYCLIPKMTFYETKKIMEAFVNEKIYDIDTKEKVADIIQSKDARANFLEFIYDHHAELEKWQAFYQERSRIRIIEWLRVNHFQFVFEEDLELPGSILEMVKKERFQTKPGKELISARADITAKSKTYYSSEALNPRPKRGRPPKQIQKIEFEPQITTDIYITIPNDIRCFLFIPERQHGSSALSSKLGYEIDLFSSHQAPSNDHDLSMASLDKKLAALRDISKSWNIPIEPKKKGYGNQLPEEEESDIDFNIDDDELEERSEDEPFEWELPAKKRMKKKLSEKKSSEKKVSQKKLPQKKLPQKKLPQKKLPQKKSLEKKTSGKKTEKKGSKAVAREEKKLTAKSSRLAKVAPSKKPQTLRPIKALKKNQKYSYN